MATWRKWVIHSLRVGFGLMLIIASVDKMNNPIGFAKAITNYKVIGESLSMLIAVWMPYLELLVGLLLVIGFWLNAAVIWNGTLMSVFFIMVLQAYVRHLDIACGCFSIGEKGNIHLFKLFENFFLMTASYVLIWFTFMRELTLNHKA